MRDGSNHAALEPGICSRATRSDEGRMALEDLWI